MPKPKAFAKESDLCAAFIAAVGPDWTPYAETCGWDILLVRNANGFQIGIQAKLKLNPMVLAQALDESQYSVDHAQPDCRAVLVPWGEVSVGLTYLCAYVGITVIRMESAVDRLGYKQTWYRRQFDPDLPALGKEWDERNWYEQAPLRRCELPEYIPDVAAGAAAPLQLTAWKISALKIAVLLEVRGFVTRADFKHLQVDHRRWTAPGNEWLRAQNGRYVPAKFLPDFKRQHPVVFEKIKADSAKWMPKQDTFL